MANLKLDEDSVDEILYLARVNETAELEAFLATLSSQTKASQADLVAAAVDPYSKNSALHYAGANGHADTLKLLLSRSPGTATASVPALLNAVNDAGNTALHWAALNGHLESVKLLVQAGADVTLINRAGHDAVYEAEINDKKDVVEWLLGAVEELEQGIGKEGDVSGGEEAGDVEMEHGAGSQNSDGAEGAKDVDEARKQMADLNTNDDGSSRAG